MDYMVHTTTTNLSFIKMHRMLKSYGVKDNKFHLALYDASLADVNPHDPALPRDMKIKIAMECKKNMWYFFRECMRIPVEGGSISYELDIGSMAQTYLMHKNINIIKEQPRQTHKTITTDAFYLWVFLFRTKNSTFMFSNKSPSDSTLNVKRFKDLRVELPIYLRMRHKKDISNVEYVESKISNNKLKAMSTATNVASADKMGRGMTAPILWFDEFAFLRFNKYVFEAAAFAFMKASENALNNGASYGITITTTPNKLDMPEGAFCKMVMDMSVKWVHAMFDMTEQEIRDYIAANSKDSDFIHIRLTWQELGKSEAWYEKQKKAVFNDARTVKREIDLGWAHSSDSSLFDEALLDTIASYNKQIRFTKILMNRFPLYAYDTLDELVPYNISIDVAAGLGRDFTAIVISMPISMRPVAIFFSNKITLPTLKDLILEITDMLPNAFLCIERNNHGISIIQEFLQNPRYTHLTNRLFYVHKEEEQIVKSGRKEKSMTVNRSGNKTKVFGIDTNESSRVIMLDLLAEKMNTRPDIFVSNFILEQISGLEVKKNGKIEHADGGHDDILFAYLVGLYASIQSTYGRFINNVGYNPELFTEQAYDRETRKNIVEGYKKVLRWNKYDVDINKTVKADDFDATIKNKKESTLMETIRSFNRHRS